MLNLVRVCIPQLHHPKVRPSPWRAVLRVAVRSPYGTVQAASCVPSKLHVEADIQIQ